MKKHKIISTILTAALIFTNTITDIGVVYAEESTEDEVETVIYEDTAAGVEGELIEATGTLDIYQAGSLKVANEDNQSAVFSNLKAESTILDGIKNRQQKIDVRECNISTKDVASIMSGIVNDHPELYYVSASFSYSYNNNNVVITIMPKYRSIDGATDEAFNAAVEKALSVVNDSMSDMEKAIAFHDYLALNCEYDEERLSNNTMPEISYTAYGALVEKIAVCQGYALAYKYLCNLVNIDCYMVTSEAINHAWNLIELDGNYYQVDVTWDDPTKEAFGRVTHKYMFVSDEAFAQSRSGEKYPHQKWKVTSGSDVVDYKATDTKYDNYFWVNCNNQMLYIDGVYYYSDGVMVDNAYWVKKYSPNDGTTTNIASVGTWDVWNESSGYWPSAYTGVYAIDGGIYCNTKDNIIRIDPNGDDVSSVYELNNSNGYIYNSFLDVDGNIEFIIGQNPNSLNAKDNIKVLSKSDLNNNIEVIEEPQDFVTSVGERVTLSVTATGDGLAYQWQYKKVGGDWTSWKNYKSASMTCKATIAWDGMYIRCVITDSRGNTVMTREVQSSIIANEDIDKGITITSEPQDITTSVGEKVTLSVTATGDGLTYQWQYKKVGGDWTSWKNYKSASMTCKATTAWDGMYIRCVITDIKGNTVMTREVQSSIIANEDIDKGITITSEPQDITTSVGEKVTLSVTATGDGLTYQWQYKKVNGEWTSWVNYKSASMTSKATAAWDGMKIRCIITDSKGNTATTREVQSSFSPVESSEQ